MDNEKIVIANEQGEEKEYTILFTFENDDKSYVLYYDEAEDEPTVFASIYDEDGHLFDVESNEEWELINDVFESFMAEDDSDDENQKEHECCCGHHHDKNHECCGKHNHDEDHECHCKHHED